MPDEKLEELKVDEQLEITEDTDDLSEEITEEVNVLDLVDNAGSDAHITFPQPEKVVVRKFPVNLVLIIISLAISIAALVFSLAKTDLTIGQGELFVESGVINEKSA